MTGAKNERNHQLQALIAIFGLYCNCCFYGLIEDQASTTTTNNNLVFSFFIAGVTLHKGLSEIDFGKDDPVIFMHKEHNALTNHIRQGRQITVQQYWQQYYFVCVVWKG